MFYIYVARIFSLSFNVSGESLEQIHIFVLAHILRRPIIVYSVKYIHNFRNEPIGFANFQGKPAAAALTYIAELKVHF